MDYEKLSSVANNIEKTARLSASYNAGKSLDEVFDVDYEEMPGEGFTCMDDYMNGDESRGTDIKKLFAAASYSAREKGVLPESVPTSPLSLASSIDEGLNIAKTAYQVGQGIIEPEKALDIVADHAESRLVTAVDDFLHINVIDGVIADGVITAAAMVPVLGPVVAPALVAVKPAIHAAVSLVTAPVKRVIRKAVHAVVGTAKSVVKSVCSGIASAAKSFVSWLFG